MYLYCYYDYPELRLYNKELLKRNNNDDNNNLYLFAPYKVNIEVMNYLEENNIDIYHKNNNGENALLLASCKGHLKVIKYLEEIGLDIYL